MSLTLPHHDGSGLYVQPQHPALGEQVSLRIRIPHTHPVSAVHVRHLHDAEPRFTQAVELWRDEWESVWEARVEVRNPTLRYRWIMAGGPTGYAWLNQAGVHTRDVPDAHDFRVVTAPAPPAWARDAIVYQVFPDRFARSPLADERPLPEWAIARAWHEPVDLSTPGHGSEYVYGGDLRGITEHLDHIASLGADVVYLTPFFPSRSNHRYDSTTFAQVDPLLGGDEALVELVEAAHARGMRVLGDFTTNHTGVTHEWFQTALADPTSVEHEFYLWEPGTELGYAAWLGVPSLPKLNFASQALFERLFGEQGVLRTWLREPFGLDGWRIDVGNMSGRYRDHDHYQQVARAARAAVDAEGEKYLVVEHCHDLAGDLDGHGWQGAMNYSGFTRPMWTWLTPRDNAPKFLGSPLMVPRLGGGQVVETMRDFTAQLPWTALVHSMNLVGSHDTTRVVSLVRGDERAAGAAAGMLFTQPGVPMTCYGDEVGMQGAYGEDGRRPFPWHDEAAWNTRMLELYRRLGAARRELPALRHGGLRWVHEDDDVIVFLRESADQRVLVVASRVGFEAVRLPLAALPGFADGRLVLGGGIGIEGGQVVVRDAGKPVTLWAW